MGTERAVQSKMQALQRSVKQNCYKTIVKYPQDHVDKFLSAAHLLLQVLNRGGPPSQLLLCFLAPCTQLLLVGQQLLVQGAQEVTLLASLGCSCCALSLWESG